MWYLGKHIVLDAIETISNVTTHVFGVEAAQREIEKQRDVFEGRADITNILDDDQVTAKENGDPFIPNRDKAKERGSFLLETGVRTRLKGAYELYRSGDELECIRHILLALGSICYALGWKKAESYLNEQNRILFEMKKDEEARSI